MKMYKENMERVTKKVAEEVRILKTQCDHERENAKILQREAERVCFYHYLPQNVYIYKFNYHSLHKNLLFYN